MLQATIILEIFALYHARGHRHYGEEVTELQHALQCAMLARQANEERHLIVACLLHDFGHLLHSHGEDIAAQGINTSHQQLGAGYLEQFFPATVIEPIRLHVEAKRYLCWRFPSYLNELSEASKLSLRLQGGVMTKLEAENFIQLPFSQEAIRLRQYDDAAKIKNLITAELETYQPLLKTLIR